MTRFWSFAVSLAVGFGCGGDSGTDPSALAEIEIQAPQALATLLVNDTVQLSVIGRERSGNVHFAGPATWRSTNAAVSVDSAGTIIGRAVGSAFVIATVGDLADSVSVTVAGTRHRVSPLSTSETWTLAGSPHLVQGLIDVTRPFGTPPVLTIEGGATVIFADGSGIAFGSGGRGSLRALGTAAAPIIMRDTATNPIPGAWPGLTFHSGDSSDLRNVTIRGCGATRPPFGNPTGCIVLGYYSFGPPTVRIENVSIESGAGGALILLQDSRLGAGSTGLSVRNMRGHIATLRAGLAAAFPLGGSFVNNDTNEIRLTGDTLRDSMTWTPGIPWAVLGPVYIEGSRSPVLTIPAGTSLSFDDFAELVVGQNWPGGLRIGVDGGATTTLRPRRSGWSGITLWAFTLPSAISNTTLEGAGLRLRGNSYGSAPAPVIKNVAIHNASSIGVYVSGGARFGVGSANLTITGTNTLVGAPMYFYESSPASIPSGVYTGNALDVIYVARLNVSQDETWKNPGIPYLISEGLGVGNVTNPTLTLEPGVTFQFTPGGLLAVGWLVPGNVRAIGTAAEPIVITGQYGAGSWGGAVMDTLAGSATLFEHVVMDGGAFELGRDIGPVIRSTLIRNVGGCAITRKAGSPWVTDFTAPALANTFENNVGPDQCGP
ncbi:MAG TPA: hypothetical protein VFO67_02525 [Gemmatimonadales bacterium]|nr:hypothetical protein [Gemmatimonadales bacterium]